MNTPLDDGGPIASVMTLGDKGEVVPVGGLSIRDWLAGMALQGLLVGYDSHENTIADCVELARNAADAMLAARKEKP